MAAAFVPRLTPIRITRRWSTEPDRQHGCTDERTKPWSMPGEFVGLGPSMLMDLLKFGETVVGQAMTHEMGPDAFHRVELRGAGRNAIVDRLGPDALVVEAESGSSIKAQLFPESLEEPVRMELANFAGVQPHFAWLAETAGGNPVSAVRPARREPAF